jgi:hypothetical protein
VRAVHRDGPLDAREGGGLNLEPIPSRMTQSARLAWPRRAGLRPVEAPFGAYVNEEA